MSPPLWARVWRLVAEVHHPVHLHLVGFRVLSRSGRPPVITHVSADLSVED
jgi:FtsP/CotA-like multicopper oxidase with cupredoxin domain